MSGAPGLSIVARRAGLPLEDLFLREGYRLEIGGNLPLRLGTANGGWLITQGRIEVFAVESAGEPPIPRFHLATLVAGEVFFAAEMGALLPASPWMRRTLLAIAVPGTQVIAVDAAAVSRLGREPEGAGPFAAGTAAWAARFCAPIPRGLTPAAVVPLTAKAEVRLEKSGLAARPSSDLVWVRPLAGRPALLGREEILLEDGGSPLPLAGDMWLASLGPTRLACCGTSEIVAAGEFWTGVAQLYRAVLLFLDGELRERFGEEGARLRRRSEHEAGEMRRALADLASVLQRDSAERSHRVSAGARESRPAAGIRGGRPERRRQGGESRAEPPPADELLPGRGPAPGADPLVEACRRIARQLGVTLRLPPDFAAGGREGVHQRLRRLCSVSGLATRTVLLRDDWWRRDHGPLLAFLSSPEGNAVRPVALLPCSARRYQLVDPSHGGAATLVDRAVSARLETEALMLYAVPSGRLRPLADLLAPAFRGRSRDLLAVALLSLAGGLLNAALPLATGILYGRLIPVGGRTQVIELALGLAAAALGAAGFQVTRSLAFLRLVAKLELRLQPAVWGHLLNLPAAFFRRYSVGDLADRVQGVGAIRRLLLADVMTAVLTVAVSSLSFGILFYLDWRLALLATALLGGVVATTMALSLRCLHHLSDALEVQGRLSSIAFALIQGVSKLRSVGAEKRAFAAWAARFAEQRRHALRAQRVANAQSSLGAVYAIGAEVAVFAVMGFGLRAGLSPSRFLAWSAAFGQVQAAILSLLALVPELLGAVPIYRRLQPLLSAVPETEGCRVAAPVLCGDIEIRGVSFRYREDGPLVLDDVSLAARPGEFIAIVGPSGSGKSTLLRLLLGFEQADAGAVLYDGLDLAALDPRSVRGQVGAVLQNSRPIAGTILTNIVGSSRVDLAAAWEAARMAGVDEDIRAMPMGMQTFIGEGAATFSGGEQQRLLIARALFSRPRILFFDEATSALDNPTQEKIRVCCERLEATRVVIAHRLSTIQHADRIYLLEGGRIVESGSYERLLGQGGRFAELVKRQQS